MTAVPGLLSPDTPFLIEENLRWHCTTCTPLHPRTT
jgi:hypothetical protein